MKITIKKMETVDEIKGKAYVHWKSWQEEYKGLVSQEYLAKLTLEKCVQLAQSFKDNHIVAKVGDQVVGFVSFGDRGEEAPNVGEIFAIYVLSDYFGTGLAQKLMKAGLDKLSNYPKVQLWVLKDNARAIRFYEKCGFKPDGAEMTSKNIGAEEIRMIKEQNAIYIGAGDEMVKLFAEKYPEVNAIPFRENFSVGTYGGFKFDDAFVAHRAQTFGVAVEDYKRKLAPIINLDFEREYVLCFGECECCKKNLEFLTNYLLANGYAHAIKIRIVDELTLETIREYVYKVN